MIELENRGDITILTLAHGKASTLDLDLCAALVARVRECTDASCRAVVLTGRGSIFSAGVDLLRVVNEGGPYISRFLPALSDSLEALFSFPKPLVAAVNGHAIAGGCLLACAADRRLMARGAGRIGVPELAVGVAFPPAIVEIVRFAVPSQSLPELVYDSVTVDADGAAERGVVDEAVDADMLIDRALAVAETLASRPAAAFTLTKQQLRAPTLDRIRAGRQALDAQLEALWSAPSTLDGIRGYIERTFGAKKV